MERAPETEARRLIRTVSSATLATSSVDHRWPYASLVLVACQYDASPLLLISKLAEHTKNITADPRVALLFDGTVGLDDRLSGARVTVLGRAVPSTSPSDRDRFLARHPRAAMYADFEDFGFFRIAVARAHLVAGFGKIGWIDRDQLLLGGEYSALGGSETSIVAHMNDDHTEAIELYATRLLDRGAGAWRMTGCDPEGCDLTHKDECARLDFERVVDNADEARAQLVELVARAREH